MPSQELEEQLSSSSSKGSCSYNLPHGGSFPPPPSVLPSSERSGCPRRTWSRRVSPPAPTRAAAPASAQTLRPQRDSALRPSHTEERIPPYDPSATVRPPSLPPGTGASLCTQEGHDVPPYPSPLKKTQRRPLRPSWEDAVSLSVPESPPACPPSLCRRIPVQLLSLDQFGRGRLILSRFRIRRRIPDRLLSLDRIGRDWPVLPRRLDRRRRF